MPVTKSFLSASSVSEETRLRSSATPLAFARLGACLNTLPDQLSLELSECSSDVKDALDALCHWSLAFVHYGRKAFDLAADHLEIAIKLNPSDAESLARRAIEKSRALQPKFTLRVWSEWEPYQFQADLEHMREGMRRAGLPE